jgi:hypothetical protein
MWYQYLKDNELASAQADKESARNKAITVLQQRLTGISVSKPRRRTAFNVWADNPENELLLQSAFSDAIIKEKPSQSQIAALRTKVTKRVFDNRPQEEKSEYEKLSHVEHAESVMKWEELTNGKPSKDLADIQAYVVVSMPRVSSSP